jgi:regulatory protein PHO2
MKIIVGVSICLSLHWYSPILFLSFLAVTIIPCNDLTIGTWRRIGSSTGNHELVAYVCDAKRCITWFIQSYGYGFKMEIPFDTIVNTEFQNAKPGSGLVIFELSRPPVFYLETVSSPRADGTVVRAWKSCGDWTENQQATAVMHHQLIGSAVQLTHVLRILRANAPGSDIHLHSPTYCVKAESPPLELPQPPLAALTGPQFQYHESDHYTHSRKRSLSGPPMLSHHSPPDDSSFPSISTEPHGSHSTYSSSFAQPSVRLPTIRPSSEYISPIFSDYVASESPHTLTHSHTQHDTYAHSQNVVGPPPYSAQPVIHSFQDDNSRIISPVSSYHVAGLRRHSSSSTILSQAPYCSPSPPLLTTPYHPPPQAISDHLVDNRPPEDLISSPPMISGMPGVSYEPDDGDLHYLEDTA